MITRRAFIGAGAGTAAILSRPGLASAAPAPLLVADPALFHSVPSHGVITLRGQQLAEALGARLAAAGSIEAWVSEADARMLAELVRFLPALRLASASVASGTDTPLGRLRAPGQALAARWG